MNGLNLDLYLRLLQIDRSTLVLAALAASVLLVGIWAGFGSRKLLRKCLILSVVSHVLLVRYGQPMQWARAGLGKGLGTDSADARAQAQPLPPGIRSLEIVDVQFSGDAAGRSSGSGKGTGGGGGGILPPELPEELPSIDNAPKLASRTQETPITPELPERTQREEVALPEAALAEALPVAVMKPERTRGEAETPIAEAAKSAVPDLTAPVTILDQERTVVPAAPAATGRSGSGPLSPLPVPDTAPRVVRPGAAREAAPPVEVASTRPARRSAVPLPSVEIGNPANGPDLRRELPKRSNVTEPAQPPGQANGPEAMAGITPAEELAPPVPFLARENPDKPANARGGEGNGNGQLAANSTPTGIEAALPDTSLRNRIRNRESAKTTVAASTERTPNRESVPLPKPAIDPAPGGSLLAGRPRMGNRPLEDIPAPYRSRLDPDKARLALQAGASNQSEKAVELALEWLRKHQDADGRWDGGTAKYRDGSVAPDEDSFTIHCPPGEVCFGECFYWEADTALTGLSLLSYLGAGYTHTQGKYADTVARGLDFLIRTQKPDGDLRGRSVAVGMYCHSMATLALCEAFALTGDDRLKDPAARAVAFLVAAQAEGGAAWRYEPKAPVGDTSILGWAVLALKSGRAVGFPVPDDCIGGIQAWLDGVSSGKKGGLAKYQPWKEVTPTMTAEAWVCRWFLKLDPNAARNREAADYLFEKGPDKDPYNLYYWYYGTLGMYQQGGKDWDRWNALVRDRIVKKQKTTGHMAGSWDPDDSQWGNYGGRIYCTALATMTLEVYYRFLRTYDEATTVTVTPR